jgi:hypothetical protein
MTASGRRHSQVSRQLSSVRSVRPALRQRLHASTEPYYVRSNTSSSRMAQMRRMRVGRMRVVQASGAAHAAGALTGTRVVLGVKGAGGAEGAGGVAPVVAGAGLGCRPTTGLHGSQPTRAGWVSASTRLGC